MKATIWLVSLAMVFLTSPVNAGSVQYCELSASGEEHSNSSPHGAEIVQFEGSATDDGIDHLFDWAHSNASFELEITMTDPDGIECRLNGTTTADFVGNGIATVNGVPGFSYFIEIEDNRPGPDTLVLNASISRRPTVRNEGIATFGAPRTIIIPNEIDVTIGASGMGWTKLHLDEVTCRYRGTGPTYSFERCTDPLDSGFVPGMSLDISEARLRIQQADHSFDLTSVEVDIGTRVPVPGTPDYYAIIIGAPDDTIFYSTALNVINGDIDINLLGPKP